MGVNKVIVPWANWKDIESEILKEVHAQMQFVFVRTVCKVLDAAFEGHHHGIPSSRLSRDLPVQVWVVPPTGSPMATQTGRPAVSADKVALITLHTQETGLMTCEGAGRILRSQNKLEVSHSDTCIVMYIIACNDHLCLK